jgi:hypothetical protein
LEDIQKRQRFPQFADFPFRVEAHLENATTNKERREEIKYSVSHAMKIKIPKPAAQNHALLSPLPFGVTALGGGDAVRVGGEADAVGVCCTLLN